MNRLNEIKELQYKLRMEEEQIKAKEMENFKNKILGKCFYIEQEDGDKFWVFIHHKDKWYNRLVGSVIKERNGDITIFGNPFDSIEDEIIRKIKVFPEPYPDENTAKEISFIVFTSKVNEVQNNLFKILNDQE